MKHYKCERCNEYKESLDNMMMVGVGLAKYVEELERQRKHLREQLKLEAERYRKTQMKKDT